MIDALKKLIVRLLRVPPEPEDPLGEESSLMVFRASPNFYRYRLFLWAIGAAWGLVITLVVFAFFETAVASQAGRWHVPLLIVGVAGLCVAIGQLVFSFALLSLDYELRWYKVTDRSLRIREGVWFVREMTMTFANIQNIEISQGPLQRLLGIADLRVQTAGGGGGLVGHEGKQNPYMFSMHEGYFRGVDNAEAIRDLMRDRLKRYRDAGLGDLEDHHREAVPAAPMVATTTFAGSGDLAEAVAGLREEASAFRAAAERLVSSRS